MKVAIDQLVANIRFNRVCSLGFLGRAMICPSKIFFDFFCYHSFAVLNIITVSKFISTVYIMRVIDVPQNTGILSSEQFKCIRILCDQTTGAFVTAQVA